MKCFHLSFFINKRQPDGYEEDALENLLSEVPEHSGAYVLGSSDGVDFVYPWGVSPVFYIGQSKNLRKRIEEHIRYTKQAMEGHDEYFWWPRYQYAAAYGLSVVWYSTRGKQNPNVLEAELVEHFYEMYGSIPIANGAWPTSYRDPHRK